jgi:ClpP class serine protease
MKHPKIIAEIESTQWAITPEALQGILRAVETGLTSEDYELFHKVAAPTDFKNNFPLVVEGTGILVVNGPIIPRADALSQSSGIVSIDQLTKDFKALEANEKVKEIRFIVDSPGGALTGISDFAQLVKASAKPTSSFIVGQAASAAYWIVSATDRIVASNTSQSGSLGIVSVHDGEKTGREIVSSQSPNKRPDLDTKEGRAVVQQVVNELADVFVETVADNREVSVDKVLSDFGQGGMVVAKRALAVGMIDEIATIDEFMSVETSVSSIRAQQITEKSLSPGITPVFGILRRQETAVKTKPAQIAGRREQHMLAEFLAENPAAKVELDAIKAEQFKAGEVAGLEKMRNENKQFAIFLRATGYPKAFREKVILALEGERSFEAIQTLADYHDMHAEEQNSQIAQEESAEQPEPAELGVVEQQLSTDGQIRSDADLEQFYADCRAGGSENVEVA